MKIFYLVTTISRLYNSTLPLQIVAWVPHLFWLPFISTLHINGKPNCVACINPSAGLQCPQDKDQNPSPDLTGSILPHLLSASPTFFPVHLLTVLHWTLDKWSPTAVLFFASSLVTLLAFQITAWKSFPVSRKYRYLISISHLPLPWWQRLNPTIGFKNVVFLLFHQLAASTRPRDLTFLLRKQASEKETQVRRSLFLPSDTVVWRNNA